jgi:hypothetical protein
VSRIAGLLLLALFACEGAEPRAKQVCAAGNERACFGDDGCRGVSHCRRDGSGFEPCACAPLDASSAAPSAGPPPSRPAPRPEEQLGLAAQCQLLFDTLAAAQKPLAETKGTGAADMREMAARLEVAAAAARRLALTDPVLVQAQLDYAAMVEELARGARDVADARDAGDPRRAAAAVERMASFQSREQAFARLVAERCEAEAPRPPPADR